VTDRVEADPARNAWPFVAAGAVLVAARLWLVAGLPVFAVGPNYVDDSAFAQLGLDLAQGEGLGPYRHYTLIKGPGYPLFIAFAWKLGVPLLLAEHALYAAACAAFCWAARSLVPSPALRLALFALLLWNPITTQPHHLRVLREGIYPAQTLLCVAAALELANARAASLRRLAITALALGSALAWLWMTREEGGWVLPALAIAAVGLAVDLIRRQPPDARQRLACYVLAAAVPATAAAGWALHNRVVYGVPAVVELNTPEFRSACGALQRATVDPSHRLVALPRATRERLYAVSPSFAELRPVFEGPLGQAWVLTSTSLIRELAGRGEIAGGWWMWALRSAADDRGWHATGAGALARYARLADEVNAACDEGRIACGPPHDSLAPPLHRSDVGPVAAATLRAAGRVIRMHGAAPSTPASYAPPDQIALFRRATGTRTADSSDALSRHPVLSAVASVYQVLVPPLSVIALGLLVWLRRRISVPGRLALAALAALFLARAALIGLIDVTSFPALTAIHLSPAYPVWLAFCGLAIAMTAGAPGDVARTRALSRPAERP
jgi:hypothetical protein